VDFGFWIADFGLRILGLKLTDKRQRAKDKSEVRKIPSWESLSCFSGSLALQAIALAKAWGGFFEKAQRQRALKP